MCAYYTHMRVDTQYIHMGYPWQSNNGLFIVVRVVSGLPARCLSSRRGGLGLARGRHFVGEGLSRQSHAGQLPLWSRSRKGCASPPSKGKAVEKPVVEKFTMS